MSQPFFHSKDLLPFAIMNFDEDVGSWNNSKSATNLTDGIVSRWWMVVVYSQVVATNRFPLKCKSEESISKDNGPENNLTPVQPSEDDDFYR